MDIFFSMKLAMLIVHMDIWELEEFVKLVHHLVKIVKLLSLIVLNVLADITLFQQQINVFKIARLVYIQMIFQILALDALLLVIPVQILQQHA